MPELPEVETVVRGLHKLVVDRKISSVIHDWPKSFPNANEDVKAFMLGATITHVRRRAKVIIIDLDSEYSLIVHLKMTGQMVFVDHTDDRFGAGHPNESLVSDLPDKSTRVDIEFADESRLFFNDQRKFGWMKLLPTTEVFEQEFFKRVGPEPLEDSFTDEVFIERIMRRPNSMIKAALLDQSVLAGVGNIYADESLWMARIHPETRVKDVSKPKLRALRQAIVDVMTISIEKGGSTDKNYVNAEGKKGSYIDFAKVFRLEGTPCQRCGNDITKTRVAGRGTHICKHCQKKR